MFVPWEPRRSVRRLTAAHRRARPAISRELPSYYQSFADSASPPLSDSNPSVVVISALGVFGFGKDKREARITTEFFVNAIHVMDGANVLEDRDSAPSTVPQARRPEMAPDFITVHNYVALPRREAFRLSIGRWKKRNSAFAARARVRAQDRLGGRRR